MLNSEEGNRLIKQNLEENKIFMVGRVGLTEVETSYCYDNKINLTLNQKHMLSNNAGVYGECFDDFLDIYINSISSSDIQVKWELGSLGKKQDHLFKKYSPNSIIVNNKSVEPFYFDSPWSYALKNKKVLVVSPFSRSIYKQFHKRHKIWSDSFTLPDFDLITYQSVQSIGNSGPHKNWLESFKIMKEEISKLEFDVAVLGCGSYGMPLSSFIKERLGKSSIYIGGGLQILFGIKGKRWDDHNIIKNFYNENWIRPLEIEKPSKFRSVEGGCYW